MGDIPLVPQKLAFTCGPACMASALKKLTGKDWEESELAKELGTTELGYTPVENMVHFAVAQGFHSELLEGETLSGLWLAFQKNDLIIVIWWDEDAGHYSIVKEIHEKSIVLMDPLVARDGQFNTLDLLYFLNCWVKRGSKIITMSKESRIH